MSDFRRKNTEPTDKKIQQNRVDDAKNNVIMVIMEPIKRRLEEEYLSVNKS